MFRYYAGDWFLFRVVGAQPITNRELIKNHEAPGFHFCAVPYKNGQGLILEGSLQEMPEMLFFCPATPSVTERHFVLVPEGIRESVDRERLAPMSLRMPLPTYMKYQERVLPH